MNKDIWFKAKKYGWGWYPSTWQGWLVLAVYLVLFIAAEVIFMERIAYDHSAGFISGYSIFVALITAGLIYVSYKKGEKPGWRWGSASTKTIDILDEEGNPIGKTANIHEIHEHGFWHRTSNVYIVNSKNEVLCQQRSYAHISHPGKWQFPIGGHILSGDTSLQTAIEELRDEIGVPVTEKDITFMGSSVKREVIAGTNIDNEYHDNYILFRDVTISELVVQEKEAAQHKWIDYTEMKNIFDRKDPDFVLHPSATVFFKYMDSHGADKK